MGFDVVPHRGADCTQLDFLSVAPHAECVTEGIGPQPLSAALANLL